MSVRKDIAMLNNEEFDILAKEIRGGFGFRKKFLFIGEGFKESQLPDKLCRQRWSGVITTSDSEKLTELFKEKDREIVCIFDEKMTIEPNTEKMPIVYLHKIDESSEGYCEEDSSFGNSFVGVLSNVMKKIGDVTSVIYTIGLYEDELKKYDLRIRDLSQEITTYYMGQKKLPKIAINNLKVYTEELADFFAESDLLDDDDDFEQNLTDKNIFYKNGKCVSLSDEELMNTRRYFTLATSGIVEGNRPIGDIQLSLAFENFLKLSPTDGPQWYGYLPETSFNVKRPFEDALVKMVTQALKGELFNTSKRYDPTKPIVLMGPPASSKSITLGSLAYKVFMQHDNPVIFIKNYDIDFSIDSKIFVMLEGLMEKIDKLNGDAKTLLIWDGSSNKDTLSMANTLANNLSNRGRKFVLVCSSYKYYKPNVNEFDMCFDNTKRSWETWNDKKHKDSTLYVRVYRRNQDFIIESDRDVTPGEIEEIKVRYKKYAGIDIDKDNLKSVLDGGTDGKDIFMYFYHLAYFLRNPLKRSLIDEQNNFSKMYDNELREIFEKKSGFRFDDICPELLEELGLSEDDIYSDAEDVYPKERFRRFQECIALFSQYKIKVPHEFAMAVLDIDTTGVAYSTDNYKIYRFVEEDIPWIRCALTDGELFFEFRNTEEARLYIQNQFEATENGFEECMNLILSLFDVYINSKQLSRTIVKCFSELVKQLGPNREMVLDSSNEFSDGFRKYFKNHMDMIIDKLEEVINEKLDYEYSLTLNKITLCREYYGDKDFLLRGRDETDDKNKYEENMAMLEKTICYTDGRIRDIKSSNYSCDYEIQKNQMITELANCNVALFERQKNYLKSCKDNNVMPADKWSSLGLRSDFEDLFDNLIQIISSEPRNGFFYNAVFKLYESYSETVKMKGETVDYDILSRLENIIENSIIIDIINRGAHGKDEVGTHINRIKEDMCGSKVTLDGVLNNSDDIAGFLEFHKKMLEKGDASSICFIANAELLRNKIIGQDKSSCKKEFTQDELEICKKVRKFMIDNRDIVKNDHNALRILFRVCWICNEKEDPYSDFYTEFRPTHMNLEQWEEINDICCYYVKKCPENYRSYFITYIYALSKVQIALISGNNVAAGFEDCKVIIKNIPEKNFSGSKRMFAPFMICKENGCPFTFNFMVEDVNQKNSGYLVLWNNPDLSDLKIKFRIRAENLDRNSIPEQGEIINDLAIGLSYTSFSVCRKDINSRGGRKL